MGIDWDEPALDLPSHPSTPHVPRAGILTRDAAATCLPKRGA